MRKLKVLAATLIVLLGLIGFGNPALAQMTPTGLKIPGTSLNIPNLGDPNVEEIAGFFVHVDSFKNNASYPIIIASGNSAVQEVQNFFSPIEIQPNSSASGIAFPVAGGNGVNAIVVLKESDYSQLGYVVTTSPCGFLGANIDAHTNSSNSDQTNCYGFDLSNQEIHFSVQYSEESGLTID